MFWPRRHWLFAKNADISKIKRALVLKGMFSETIYVCVYLCAKFEVSSIILTSFRQGGNFTPLPPQNEPLKSPPRLGLKPFLAKLLGNTSLYITTSRNATGIIVCTVQKKAKNLLLLNHHLSKLFWKQLERKMCNSTVLKLNWYRPCNTFTQETCYISRSRSFTEII